MELELRRGALEGVAQTYGGELTALRRDGVDYLWRGDPAYWAGRNPLLFPIVGSLWEGTVRFGGRPYHMGRHGFGRSQEFTVARHGEDFVVFSLRENDETLAQYPYPFSLEVEHRLLEDGFSTRFQVEATGTEPTPFCIGAHPAFRCPLGEGERFQDYELVFDRPETADSLLVDAQGLIHTDQTERLLTQERVLPLDYALFARLDTVIFRGLRSTAVSLRHRETGRGVRMWFGGFPMIAFWTKGDLRAPYLCLEPWHGCAALAGEGGEFTDKLDHLTLQPGERKSLEYRVELLPPR